MNLFRTLRSFLFLGLANLVLLAGPVITTQPTGGTVALGSSKTFSVTTKSERPTYQWRFNTVSISGATSRTYVISSVTAAHAGSYDVVVSDTSGSTTSTTAVLSIVGAPAITTQPQSKSKAVGQSTTFTVAATGTAPLTYQWKKNGISISGATSSSLALSNIQPADAGTYTVTVANAAGTVTSAGATLTVLQPPVITQQPASQTINLGQSVTFSVTATGPGTLSYVWYRTSSQNNSQIPGATAASYSFTPVAEDHGSSYYVIVYNANGGTTSAVATLSINLPPTIIQQPGGSTGGIGGGGYTVVSGRPVSFSVVASGTAPLSYQWRKAGTPVAGATAATWTIASAQLADSGSYDVVVSNPWGSATSTAFTLTVLPKPSISQAPASLVVAAGSQASFSVTANGAEPLSYQWTKNTVNLPGATAATYTIPSAQPGDSGTYGVTVSNPYGTDSASATLTVVTPPVITTQPQSMTKADFQPASFSVSAAGGLLSYQWRKGGVAISGATNPALAFAPVRPTDAGSYEVVIQNAAGTVTSAAATLSVTLVPPAITAEPRSCSVVEPTAATFNATVTGSVPLTYQWTKGGVAIAGATGSSSTSPATFSYTTPATAKWDDGSSYAVTVTNSAGGALSNSATLTVTATGVAASITAQPVGTSVTVGQPATFTVTAAGTDPLAYQWKKNGMAVPGATAASYTTPATALADNGNQYAVVVSNSYGNPVSSNTVTLTVTAPVLGALTWKRDVIYLGTKEVAEIENLNNGNVSINVTLTDHLGSPRFEVRGDGSVIEQKFAPFGESLTDPTTMSKFAKGYTNHEQTDPSGLIYMQARFYAPMYHRFLSPDPARDQHFEQTQSWNIYSYVQNNPVMSTDPTGMFETDVHKKITINALKLAGIKQSTFSDRIANRVVETDHRHPFQNEQHFDNKTNYKEIVNNWNNFVSKQELTSTGIGNALHAAQDLYSHSNYVEIYLGIHPDAKPGDIPTITTAIQGGDKAFLQAIKSDLRSGTFSAAQLPIASINEGPNSHDQMNKDSPTSGHGADLHNGVTMHEYAKDVATRQSAEILKKHKDEIK